ncbi:M1 family aminopeptidase [Marinoscillum furvescens]|uniref:Aminopeptidase N n=1 Tax=Marinoscillum furvescens DSM 4134 TaxID=1122208 RepID=A0A3D9L3H5_MARFU|nr:M1 family aminopeptidase [Marinoscillum furvescens]RED96641.1 putative secreted protein (Por secretion system target) [Marinoscillum furvescens DSM 4134]
MHRLLILLLLPHLLVAQHYHTSSVLQQRPTPSSSSATDLTYVFLDLNATNTSTQLSGRAELTFQVKTTTQQIVLELTNELSVSQVSVNNSPTTYAHSNDLLSISSPSGNFEPRSYTIAVSYSGKPTPANNNIFSGINNASSNAWGNQITWTLSEPFNAKMWWPAKQDLSDKIDSADIHITIPGHLKAGSNGVLQSVVNLPNNKVRYEWSTRYPMAYYLMAFAVGAYVEYNNYAHPADMKGDSILIQNYLYDNPETLPYYRDQLDMIPQMLELFSELLGPYPFRQEKYGHMMAPFSGGMEHQTMSSMGIFTFGLNAHELGHQWFGNHVTCATWNDIWINEGFARFCEYLAAERLLGASSAKAAIANDMLAVINLDTGSIYIPDHHPLTDKRIFNFKLTYAKGGLMLNMIRQIIRNDEVFFETLRKFLSAHQNGTATGEDFRLILEAESQRDFSEFFEQWYYGNGYPIFNIAWTKLPGNTISIAIDQSTSHLTELFTTPLEFHITFKSGQTKRILLTQQTNKETFLIAAKGSVERVTFDPNGWLIKKVDRFVQTDENGNVILNNQPDEPALFPNPVSDWLYISAPAQKLRLSNSAGQLILEASDVNELNVAGLSPGLYFVEVIPRSGHTQFHRLIKN